VKALFVTSSGGHLAQVLALEPWWKEHERRWVSAPTPDAEQKLADEDVTWAFYPTTRNVPNLMRNVRLAHRLVRSYRPDVVVSTGAGVAVPFFWVARLFGARTVFLEVLDRIDSRTLTGMLCYPVADLFLVQWEEQQRLWPGSTVIGRVL
jgi:UDP-N-acetylglucosamine:LPS N-acetylglucosamine transferase